MSAAPEVTLVEVGRETGSSPSAQAVAFEA